MKKVKPNNTVTWQGTTIQTHSATATYEDPDDGFRLEISAEVRGQEVTLHFYTDSNEFRPHIGKIGGVAICNDFSDVETDISGFGVILCVTDDYYSARIYYHGKLLAELSRPLKPYPNPNQ